MSAGSWLCENAKTLNRDRRTCSSKTILVAQRASGFNRDQLKYITLRRVSIFEFLHSHGQIRKSGRATRQPALPSRTGIISRAYEVRKVPTGDVGSHRQMKEAAN